MAVVKITGEAEFTKEILQDAGLVLVHFYTDNCQYCQMVAGPLEKTSEEFAGKLKVCSLDADVDIDLARKYRIDTVPTFILFQKGTVVKVQTVSIPRPEILKLVK